MRISDWSSDVCSSDLALVSSRTRAIVLINPNNPTGATYPRELLERIVAIAARHDLLLMCAEIYDGILYDDAKFVPVAPIAGDVPCLSFGGLSKVHRACGWRVGWAVLSGDRSEEHTSELQSLMRYSYAVFCLKKKKN